MEYFKGNRSYPLVTKEEEIVTALSEKDVAGVVFRFSGAEQDITHKIANGFAFSSNPSLAREYRINNPVTNERNRFAGSTLYHQAVTVGDFLREADGVGLVIQPEILEVLTARARYIEDLYLRVYANFNKTGGRQEFVRDLLFTPKGGFGRSERMHVDNFKLAAHSSFNQPSLILAEGTLTASFWEIMDRKKSLALSDSEREERYDWLSEQTKAWREEFMSSATGDVVFMKGQYGRNLLDSEDQKQVCVHASSSAIELYGQAAVLYYNRELDDPC